MMTVQLSSVGNPDFQQDPTRELYGCEASHHVQVRSFREASKVCRAFITRNNLGGGNWDGGKIFKDGEPIARVAYNGRVFEGPLYRSNSACFYEPGEAGCFEWAPERRKLYMQGHLP